MGSLWHSKVQRGRCEGWMHKFDGWYDALGALIICITWHLINSDRCLQNFSISIINICSASKTTFQLHEIMEAVLRDNIIVGGEHMTLYTGKSGYQGQHYKWAYLKTMLRQVLALFIRFRLQLMISVPSIPHVSYVWIMSTMKRLTLIIIAKKISFSLIINWRK